MKSSINFSFCAVVQNVSISTDNAQVESTHATPYTEAASAEDGESRRAAGGAASAQSGDARPSGGGNGIVGTAVAGSGGGGDGKNGVKVPQRRRRSSSGSEAGGRKALQHRGVGYPMTAVAAVLRQLHMRVLSVEEMKMLDQVHIESNGFFF